MAGLWDKLNLKEQQDIVVLNAPKSFATELELLAGVRVRRQIASVRDLQFALMFVTGQAEVNKLSKEVIARTADDPIIWFAYPKGTSKRYQCKFNRDTGWDVLRKAGFDTVRAVAIDEDWTALRFRRVEFIKQRTRGEG